MTRRLAKVQEAPRWCARIAERRRPPAGLGVGLPTLLSVEDVAAWLAHLVAITHVPRFGLLLPPPIGLEVVATTDGIRHVLLVPESMEGAVLAVMVTATIAMAAVRAGLAGRPAGSGPAPRSRSPTSASEARTRLSEVRGYPGARQTRSTR